MQIGIDALPLMGRGGISRHLRDLFPALVTAGRDHTFHLIARVFGAGRRERYRGAVAEFGAPNVRWRRVVVPDRVLEAAWTRRDVVIPGTARYLRRLDVLVATASLAPAGAGCPVVGIVHDLVPLRFPEWFGSDALLRLRLARLVDRSRLLLAISDAARRDLVELLGVPSNRIRVVHHGVHPRFAPLPAGEATKRVDALGIPTPFLLYVGGVGRIKNIDGLVTAYQAFRAAGGRDSLVLAGDLRWDDDLAGRLERLGLARHVRCLGFVTDDMLVPLYGAATAVVIPSWYEGFGFPAVEAMACGAPVVASHAGALPEVLGDAALFFPPDAPDQLAAHLRRVAEDSALRHALIARGRARAPRFTWARAARETLAVLEEAAA